MKLFATNVSILFLSISILLGSFTFSQSYSERSSINWGEICRNSIVDALISEPCSTLTTNGGYELTTEGERVIACIAGGGALLLIDPTGSTLAAAKLLGSSVGCSGSSGQYSNNDPVSGLVSNLMGPNSQDDSIGSLLSGIFGK